jgi:hypothetical protein
VRDEIEKNKKTILSLPAILFKKNDGGQTSPQAGLGGANNLSLPTPF